MFKSRAALAATLSAHLRHLQRLRAARARADSRAARNISNSEKYEIKVRDWDKPGNIKPYITWLNRARRDNPALQQTSNLRFLGIEDSNVIGFVKESVDNSNIVAGAIALSRDVHDVWLPLGDVQVPSADGPKPVAAVENLMTGERHAVEWGGIRLWIDPERDPAVLLRCLA